MTQEGKECCQQVGDEREQLTNDIAEAAIAATITATTVAISMDGVVLYKADTVTAVAEHVAVLAPVATVLLAGWYVVALGAYGSGSCADYTDETQSRDGQGHPNCCA